MGNATMPTFHQKHRRAGVCSRERTRRSWPGCDQDAPARPRSHLWPLTRSLWWRLWSRRPETVHRHWSSSSGRRSRVPTVARRAAQRSHGCCILGWFCPRSMTLTALQRTHTSWRHRGGRVKYRSGTPFREPGPGFHREEMRSLNTTHKRKPTREANELNLRHNTAIYLPLELRSSWKKSKFWLYVPAALWHLFYMLSLISW